MAMTSQAPAEKPLLAALRGEPQWPRPAWLMRQAGRYLPEYRQLRADKRGFLDLCDDPAAATEVTLQPIRRYGFDGSILFSDILTIPRALGQDLHFSAGEGPVLGGLPDQASMMDHLDGGEAAARLAPAYNALGLIRAALPTQTTLIGFAGAPWTLATYMIEGGASKSYPQTKAMAYGAPEQFRALMDLLIRSVADHLIAQIAAGADAVMVFDSWAGSLDARAQVDWSAGPLAAVTARIRQVHPDVPVILFPRRAPHAAQALAGQHPLVTLQVDFADDLASAAALPFSAVQGNLDPGRLLAGRGEIQHATQAVLNAVPRTRSHVFNLGHGILKETDPDAVHAVLETIRG